ncbi:MAG TPA: endonuclease III [Candidatus Omnitrophota bacterium]|nr:endonuclease III [Candidatus Omnitrophota bacterium]
MINIDEILKRLKDRYNARIALNWSDPWELLVATILSAQCTDARVNKVTESLFKKYRTMNDYARADIKQFELDIRTTGFYHSKAKNVIECASKILRDFGGSVPDDMDKLITLPGVARKTANVVLFNAFGKNEGIAVDTHVRRVSQRLGLTRKDDPKKIELDLMRLMKQKEWGDFSLRVILHGRETCVARNPKCPDCVLASLCPSRKKFYPDI